MEINCNHYAGFYRLISHLFNQKQAPVNLKKKPKTSTSLKQWFKKSEENFLKWHLHSFGYNWNLLAPHPTRCQMENFVCLHLSATQYLTTPILVIS